MGRNVRSLVGAVVWLGMIGAAALGLGMPNVVRACSAGPDFDPLSGIDVLIAGYGLDVEILGKGTTTYLEVAVSFEVDRYLLGQGPRTVWAPGWEHSAAGGIAAARLDRLGTR